MGLNSQAIFFDELPTILEFFSSENLSVQYEEVERANQEIIRHLRDIIIDTRIHTDWYKYLPNVQQKFLDPWSISR